MSGKNVKHEHLPCLRYIALLEKIVIRIAMASARPKITMRTGKSSDCAKSVSHTVVGIRPIIAGVEQFPPLCMDFA